MTAVKRAEDDNALVFRFYEWAGKDGEVKLQLPPGAETASETDLMERPTASLPVKNSNVTLRTKAYEIKTIKVQYPSTAPAAQP